MKIDPLIPPPKFKPLKNNQNGFLTRVRHPAERIGVISYLIVGIIKSYQAPITTVKIKVKNLHLSCK